MKKTKKMKTLVIKMNKWLRGCDTSYLHRSSDGKQCCLGFLARSCGAEVGQIADECSPGDAPEIKWPKGLLEGHKFSTAGYAQNSDLCGNMMEVNDDQGASDADRIKKLRPLFAKIGYKLIFKAK
jgi:hypothetical protein